MDANVFIAQLKSEPSSDLVKLYDEYRAISGKLPAKDKGSFALNLLCVICRNLDKVPSWKDIDTKVLLSISIDCARETRFLDRNDRVKTLACVYHIHRHAVRQFQIKPIPPELILKISFVPFELDSKHLLQEYHKTYWNILADRISFIERLKTKVNINKFLPQLTEDLIKVVQIYETVAFSTNIFVFLIKKLHFLYKESPKELSQVFVQIFTKISEKDLKVFKRLTEEETLEVYVKLNECLYVVADNASKIHFKQTNLDLIVRTCISLVGHRPDLFHCLQTFYLNAFVCIFKTNLTFTESILNGLLISFETTEKLGYNSAMIATYPFLSQFLRLYIEYNIANATKKSWTDNFDSTIQEKCLYLIKFLMKRLENCEQLLKCENCSVRTGYHDALRISFLIKHFITVSVSQKILITSIFPSFHTIVLRQYEILSELRKLNCSNYEICFRKHQTDIHNTAIALNKAQYYEFSIKLFDIYLKHELAYTHENSRQDYKNITRAFYNKSICELDCKLYEKALTDGFLSLIFSEDLSSEKYMSLIIDIKAKEFKSRLKECDNEEFQNITVLDACQKVVENKLYGDLEWFISKLKFSDLLKHEFKMYAKLWPSIAPIGGVWSSLLRLYKGTAENWIQEEFEDNVLESLHEVILETPTVVRTIHSEYFTGIVREMLDQYDETTLGYEKSPIECKLVHVALLCLQFDYDIREASTKCGWKSTEPILTDVDQIVSNRTIMQEHAATARAIVAVRLLTHLLPHIQLASSKYLQEVLRIYEMYVPHLLHLYRLEEGLQLAYICCRIAHIIDDNETYVRNAGVLLYNTTQSVASDDIIALSLQKLQKMDSNTEAYITFICEAAVYYARCDQKGVSAKLVQLAQAKVLKAKINLDLAQGRLLEAQVMLCGPTLSAVNTVLRHYLAMPRIGTSYKTRHMLTMSSMAHHGASWRRLLRRAAFVAQVRQTAAVRRMLAYCHTVDTDNYNDSQIKIDSRLKHIIGLQPNETREYTKTEPKLMEFTHRLDIETMVENLVCNKTPSSPTISCTSIPAFKIPEFFNHTNCSCHACEMPITLILACKITFLEASMYFRAKEMDISRNYFNGVLQMLNLVGNKLEIETNREFESFILNSVKEVLKNEFDVVQIETLIELSYFEMKNENLNVSDEYIVRIHEIMQGIGRVDDFLSNDVMNLMTASAHMKNIVKRTDETGLEVEFDSLKLSPGAEPPKTPESRAAIPTIEKIIVKNEEIPKKLKVIKLNLDEEKDDENFEKRIRRKFKIPNPKTSKPFLEEATPRPKDKPKIIVTQAGVHNTPKTDQRASTSNQNTSRTAKKTQNFVQNTPKIENTPNTDRDTSKSVQQEFKTPFESPEQFFTPMTSTKTYKKPLRSNIVKNLEQEFSTPKTRIDKENISLSVSTKGKKHLKRATSPGKLSIEKKEVKAETSRPRRLRQQVKLSLDD